jgi:hypothetical protein
MTRLRWWLRIVGALYVLDFVMKSFVQAPIKSIGPADVLDRAAAGDPTARLVVDTWVGFGLETGAVGAVLLIASRRPELAKPLVWTVIAIELLRGLAFDSYMIARGYPPATFFVWIVIHIVIIASGLLLLRNPQPAS